MNTKLSSEELKSRFKSLQESKIEEELIGEDADILMANYLSEIERIQRLLGMKRKDLAKEIKTSASYLTQVFRGDKPLNFYTIAKIKRVLKIKFSVIASFVDNSSIILKDTKQYSNPIISNGVISFTPIKNGEGEGYALNNTQQGLIKSEKYSKEAA
jgi:transcriptional regulator with XRE-family HTH domain